MLRSSTYQEPSLVVYKISNIFRQHLFHLWARTILRSNSKHKWTHHIQNTSQLSTNPHIHNIKKSNHIQIVHNPQVHTPTLTTWFDSQHQKIKPYSNSPQVHTPTPINHQTISIVHTPTLNIKKSCGNNNMTPIWSSSKILWR
jgi:hypothetical protein